jgi:hypothetical protein
MSQLHKHKIQFHFQHITSNIPKHVTDIYETKRNKITRHTQPIKNHVLYEFCPCEKTITEEYQDPDPNPDPEINGLVDFVVDSYVDFGELYHGEKKDAENNIEYNPMNFSLRHYISSK